jgi:hypothetical protein
MVTHTYPLAETASAIQAVRDRDGLKIQVAPAAAVS